MHKSFYIMLHKKPNIPSVTTLLLTFTGEFQDLCTTLDLNTSMIY